MYFIDTARARQWRHAAGSAALSVAPARWRPSSASASAALAMASRCATRSSWAARVPPPVERGGGVAPNPAGVVRRRLGPRPPAVVGVVHVELGHDRERTG